MSSLQQHRQLYGVQEHRNISQEVYVKPLSRVGQVSGNELANSRQWVTLTFDLAFHSAIR